MKCLNLGCGLRFHPDWTNLDLSPADESITFCDFRKGLPFPEATFDVVYHSHVLEHIPRTEVSEFLRECWRVLKIGGILRVVTPDLEDIVQSYLQALARALQGQPGAENDYDWMIIELYDQAVRERSGGAMRQYMRQDFIPNEDFVVQRLGCSTLKQFRGMKTTKLSRSPARLVSDHVARVSRTTRQAIAKAFLTSEERRGFKVGQFRMRGEVHRWMYDRYSLARTLLEAGFDNPVQRTACESAIVNWIVFHLDTEPDGSLYKPHSLYMEAVKSLL